MALSLCCLNNKISGKWTPQPEVQWKNARAYCVVFINYVNEKCVYKTLKEDITLTLRFFECVRLSRSLNLPGFFGHMFHMLRLIYSRCGMSSFQRTALFVLFFFSFEKEFATEGKIKTLEKPTENKVARKNTLSQTHFTHSSWFL